VDNDLSDAFPQFEILVSLFLTLPIGIASAEKSFSVLRRLKNYMRSTMGQQRLSDMTLLAIEDQTAAKLKLDDVIKLLQVLRQEEAAILNGIAASVIN